jgi:hypothetical protein
VIIVSYIRYQIKNGVEYASVYTALRADGKKVNKASNLGRVIDKEKGVYQSRDRGVYIYSLESGYSADETPQCELAKTQPRAKERYILDFGDSFLLNQVMIKTGMLAVLEKIATCAIAAGGADTLLAMVSHRLLDVYGASRYAQEWWEGSYARMLYPKAEIESQRVSEFLSAIGEEGFQRLFFHEYLLFVSGQCSHGILIDSTGLPNDIRFPLTAINNHNGLISNEARLILVVDRQNGLPIYFRYVAGNIVDVSTLRATMAELAAYHVDVNFAIVDAGYYSDGNIIELQAAKVPFVIRLMSNRKLYKLLVAENIEGLEHAGNLVRYAQRLVYIKRVGVEINGVPCFAYIAIDVDRKHDECKKYAMSALEGNDVSAEEMDAEMREKGLFILLSAVEIEPRDILPVYYQRQTIEQVFDFSKNNAELIPLRVHSERTFRGHLMLSFVASTVFVLANRLVKSAADTSFMSALHLFRNLKCKVFKKSIVLPEANKQMNDIAKKLKIKIPLNIPLT